MPNEKSKWDQLSLSQKAGLIKIYVNNGFSDMKSIREDYNNKNSDRSYNDWKKKIAEYKGLDVDNDNTYDYEGFYNENPERAYNMLNENPEAHFTDKYKLPTHPTFSDESNYSNDKTRGGHWVEHPNGKWEFQHSDYTVEHSDATNKYLEENDSNSFATYKGNPILKSSTITANKKANGGTLPLTQSLQEQNKTNLKTGGNISFAEWYTKNYKKDYSEFFNRYNKFAGGGDKLQDKNDDIEKQEKGKVPILPKILGTPRFIEKKTNGLINKDKAHYLYDSPEDWAKKIFNEEELDTIRHNLYENFTPIGYTMDDIVRFFNAAQGKNELIIPEERWGKDVRYGYNQSGSIYGPAQRDEYFANYLGISPNERRGYIGNNILVRTDLRPTKGTTYDDVFSFDRTNNRYFEKNLVDTFFNAEDALKSNGLVNLDLGTFTGVRKIRKGKSNDSYLIQGMVPGLFGPIFQTIAKEDAASGTWTLSSGVDPYKGQYISYYDDYDLNPSLGGNTAGNPIWLGMFPIKKGDASGGIGKPFTVYDRVYLDDYYGVDSKPEDGYYGGYITPSIITADRKADGGLLDRLKSIFRFNKDDSNNPEYISYFDAPVELRNKANLPNRVRKFNTESTSEYGDSHYDVFEARYRGLKRAMQDESIPDADIERLLPFVITQNILEGGYRLKRDDNNFGGMMISKGNENIGRMKFKTPEEYYKKYIQNLDKKWGDEYLGENKGWRHAKSIEDYARILNREDLGLTTEEKYDAYKSEHADNPPYLYTPEWKNNYKPLMHNDRFGGIYPRVNAYMTLLNDRIKAFDKYAKDNNLIKEGKIRSN